MFWLKHLSTKGLPATNSPSPTAELKMRNIQGEDGMGCTGGGQSLKPSQQDGAEQIQVPNPTSTSIDEAYTQSLIAQSSTTLQDQKQIWSG